MADEAMKAKVLLLGDGGVGKTSLIRRFVVDQFSDDYITTIGTKVSKKDITVGKPPNDMDIIMQIWDVLGQKGYGGVQETAMKGAQGVLFVHDLTREETRRSMEEYWMPMVWRLVGRIPMVIVGNKVDLLEEERIASHEYTYYLQEKYDTPAIMTSAKSGESVEGAFKVLGEMVVESAGVTIERLALVTPPQEPVDLLIRVADKIMTDFCYQLGSVDAGMPVVKRQFERAGVDVRAPSVTSLRKAIENLAAVENDFKNAEEIAANKARRLAWLEGRDVV